MDTGRQVIASFMTAFAGSPPDPLDDVRRSTRHTDGRTQTTTIKQSLHEARMPFDARAARLVLDQQLFIKKGQ